MPFAGADQIAAPHAAQGFAQDGPVRRVVIAQKRFMQFALSPGAHDGDLFGGVGDFT